MFKKSVHIDLIYTELSFEERIKAAKKDGFDAVELYWGWEGRDLKKIKQTLDENGMFLSAISGDLPKDSMISMCDPAQKEEYLASVKRSIEAAKELGCPYIIIHAAAIDNKPPFQALTLSGEYSYIRKMCAMYDVLKTIAPWAEEAGVMLVLEELSETAHSGYLLKDIETTADFIRAVGSPNLKVLFDAYHVYLQEGRVIELMEEYIQDIGLVHIADAPGRHEPGTGAVNWSNVLKRLNELGYDGCVSFELYPIESSEKAVAAIKDVLKDIK